MFYVLTSAHSLLDAGDTKVHRLWDLPLYLFKERGRQDKDNSNIVWVYCGDTQERIRISLETKAELIIEEGVKIKR